MNHILRLQSENAELRAKLATAENLINRFRAELTTSKFQGVDLTGERKDWMSVKDIDTRLVNILGEVL